MKRAAGFELLFSLLGAGIFLGLWIFMTTSSNCVYDEGWALTIKIAAMAGFCCSMFVMFHSCFEQRVAIGRGIFGCIIFFVITLVTFANIAMGFIAMNCICRCIAGQNAFKVGSTEDEVIFCATLAGSFCLILILLISSVSHS